MPSERDKAFRSNLKSSGGLRECSSRPVQAEVSLMLVISVCLPLVKGDLVAPRWSRVAEPVQVAGRVRKGYPTALCRAQRWEERQGEASL